jgi:uncharacterized membrane protein
MAEVIAVVVDTVEHAHGLVHAALQLQETGALVIYDAVIVDSTAVEHDDDAIDPRPTSLAVPASAVGAIVGMLVAGPLGFMLGGAAVGAAVVLASRLKHGRFSRDDIAELSRLASEGGTAEGPPSGCVVGLLMESDGEPAFALLAEREGARPVRLRAA